MAATGTTVDAELAEVCRDLHAHPELGFGETRTAAIVAGRRPGPAATGTRCR